MSRGILGFTDIATLILSPVTLILISSSWPRWCPSCPSLTYDNVDSHHLLTTTTHSATVARSTPVFALWPLAISYFSSRVAHEESICRFLNHQATMKTFPAFSRERPPHLRLSFNYSSVHFAFNQPESI